MTSYPQQLTPVQEAIVATPFDAGKRIFVRGPAGSGKTTALQRRLISLLAAGLPSYTVLTLLPETGAADAYHQGLAHAGLGPYSDLSMTTYPGFAREMVTLFWPLIARPAGFANPHAPPVFLSYDLAQVQMKLVVAPMLEEGAFDGLRMRPQQILSQLLDNLNRSALNGLSLEQMEERLLGTWSGAPEHLNYFRQAGDAAQRFRSSCLNANLLDLSLVVDLFQQHLLRHPVFVRYFTERYRHLLVDNVEELPPAGAELLQILMPAGDSAILAYDEEGGYKRYLAADPEGALALTKLCSEVIALPRRLNPNQPLDALADILQGKLVGPVKTQRDDARQAIHSVINPRYRREMIQETITLITDSLLPDLESPSQIAIITPYLDGTLRYGLTRGLARAGVPYRLLRRRGNPRDEPLVRAWLTLAMLAHPHWNLAPSPYDVAEGLSLAVGWLDRPRATLAARALFDPAGPCLRPTSTLTEPEVERIGPRAVEQLDVLQTWLDKWPGTESLDRFLGHLFTDLLGSQRFRSASDSRMPLRPAAVCDWLIKAATRFRRAAPALGLKEFGEQGRTFTESIYEGIVTGAPLPDPLAEETEADEGVIIATLYAYLLTGPTVQTQIWLEAGASGWWEIPRQPLSNAFVLAPSWEPDRPWTEADSAFMRDHLLARVAAGLCARCQGRIVLASSQLDRRGERQEGQLWRALAPLLKS